MFRQGSSRFLGASASYPTVHLGPTVQVYLGSQGAWVPIRPILEVDLGARVAACFCPHGLSAVHQVPIYLSSRRLSVTRARAFLRGLAAGVVLVGQGDPAEGLGTGDLFPVVLTQVTRTRDFQGSSCHLVRASLRASRAKIAMVVVGEVAQDRARPRAVAGQGLRCAMRGSARALRHHPRLGVTHRMRAFLRWIIPSLAAEPA